MTVPQRLKANPVRGMPPSLEFRPLDHLSIDGRYQRSIDTGPSARLIRKIAVNWDWSLCQPLVVAKREDGTLWVIDGQHRLAAARLRADISNLPCVVVPSVSAGDEAAAFVALNQQRRPLSALELFRASLESGDPAANAIMRAMEATGLKLATTNNYDSLKPGHVPNIGGVQRCMTQYGEAFLRDALHVGALAFEGQQLRYFGTIFPGIVAAIAALPSPRRATEIAFVAEVLGGGSQEEWVVDIRRVHGAEPDIGMREAAERAVLAAIAEARGELEAEAS